MSSFFGYYPDKCKQDKNEKGKKELEQEHTNTNPAYYFINYDEYPAWSTYYSWEKDQSVCNKKCDDNSCEVFIQEGFHNSKCS